MKIAVCLALLIASTVATSPSESGTPVAHNHKLAFAPGYTGGLCKDMLCPEKKAPVCGSDGVRMITYPNECELHLDTCNNPDNSNITLLANEPCPLPVPQTTRRKLLCSSDQTGPCNDVICPEEDAPVCGSDGVTYPNACELGLAANNNPGLNIKLLSNKPCPLPSSDAPVCGSDGVTYPNACELGLAANNYPERNITQVSSTPCACSNQK
ncbi:protease inhibitor Epi11 [Phytophthora megakarya]|uniref:Protease inhibitor Epi11 n=1 Tax=Phytophthora megakarya TaxID=4795 RepID=A0A225VL08_9STRA|nr:protease inhibitor Epi11 [Phytophthora megakarya]